jgi:hypothetical protein
MTCAFVGCDETDTCAMVGGCVRTRFAAVDPNANNLKKGARALAGTKPARTNRDPALIKRKRKAL